MTIETKYPNAKPGVYRVGYDCSNCGWTGEIPFTKGKVAPMTATCPICEVSGAKKSLSYRRTESTEKDPVLIPIIPGAWPKNPTPPSPRPEHPWDMPCKPYRPWNVPTRPYLGDIGNDIDRADTHWREDTICIDDPDEGLGFLQ